MGLAFTGTSVGGMIMNPINTWLVQTYGWRKSYVILGVVMMLITIPLVLFIVKTRPSEMNLLPDGDEPAEREIKELTGHTLQQAIRTGMIPIDNTMMVVGIVSLPGMMTGQLLSGTAPLDHIHGAD